MDKKPSAGVSFWRKTKSKPVKDEKITPAGMIWIAFNLVVNVSLAISFAGIIYGQSGTSSTTVGYHILWILVVDFLVAGICAYAYLRLGQHHRQGDGGAYIYVRSGWGKYGRFWGLFNIISTYLVLPVTITSNIIALVRQNFINGGSPIAAHWGVMNNFILDMIGIGVYIALSIIILWGTRWVKNSVFFANYFRWFAIILTLGFALYLVIDDKGAGYNVLQNNTHLTFSNFSHAFLTAFFFFLGFESFTVINTKVKDSVKTMPKVIAVTMIATIITYLVITVIMMGTIMSGDGGFAANPNLKVFQDIGSHGVFVLGAVVILITAFATKSNSTLQFSIYSNFGAMGVAANEGYLSKKMFDRKNRYGCYYRGVLLNLIITLIGAVLLLLIPDIIAWARNDIINAGTKTNPYWTTKTYFDFTTIVSLSSVMLVANYFMVNILAILLRLKHKIEAIKMWEVCLWIFGCAALIVSVVGFFYQIIQSLIQNTATGALIANVIQLVYFVATYVIAIVWYYVYYLPILKQRLRTNPMMQAKLDAHFIILTKANRAQDFEKLAYDNIKKSHFAKLLPTK